MTSVKVCDWSGHLFGVRSASPRPLTKKLAMSPSSTVHGGQHDSKYCYVTFELLMHAAFVADEIWGFMLEQARTWCTFEIWTLLQYQIKTTAMYECMVRCLKNTPLVAPINTLLKKTRSYVRFQQIA